jgi:hypothetical protein
VADATRTAARALAQLERLGTTYTLSRDTRTADTTEPWKVSTSTAGHTVTGALVDFSAADRARLNIGSTDRQSLIAASGLGVVPEPAVSLSS